jgi:hypothetical protein
MDSYTQVPMSKAIKQHYLAFGLIWNSPALPLPALPNVPNQWVSENSEKINIASEKPELWPGLPESPLETPFLQVGCNDLRLKIKDLGQFRVSGGDKIAWHRNSFSVPDHDLSTYLLGPPLAALLIQRGMLVLHGNAVEKGGKALVFMGHSGGGKSTLAYALMRQGWNLLADDLVVVTESGDVLPGIPCIKLWLDAAMAFGLTPDKLTPAFKGLKKYMLMGDAIKRATEPARLQKLYVIQQHLSNNPNDQLGSITQITDEKAGVLELLNHVFRRRFVRGLGQEGPIFLALAGLQSRIPMAKMCLPAGISAMENWLEEQDLLRAHAGS